MSRRYKTMLLVRKFGRDDLFCYDTDDYTVELTTLKDVKELYKTHKYVFDGIIYKNGNIGVTRFPNVTTADFVPDDIIEINEHTKVWINKQLGCNFIFSWSSCFVTDKYMNTTRDVPIVHKNTLAVAKLTSLYRGEELYYFGEYTPVQIKRLIMLKGTKYMEEAVYKAYTDADVYATGINLEHGDTCVYKLYN